MYNSLVKLILLSILCISCAQNDIIESKKEVIKPSKAIIEENSDKRDLIFNKIYGFIANKYYKHPSHRVVKVCLNNIKHNINDEPVLGAFLQQYISNKLNSGAYCTKITDIDDPKLDCIVDVGLIDAVATEKNFPITILVNIIEPKNRTLIFAEKFNFNISNFNLDEYSIYKNDPANQEKNAFLTVRAVNIGSSYKAKDKSGMMWFTGPSGSSQPLSWSKDTGNSGYYPAKQQCVINGKMFKMGEDKTFFSENISSGTTEIIATFNEAFWDGYNQQQKILDKCEKKFKITAKDGDKIFVDIAFIYRGEGSSIRVNAYRQLEIIKGQTIETVKEIIEIFE